MHGGLVSHRSELPDDLRAGPFRVGAAGLTPSRVRSSDLFVPAWGLRVLGAGPLDTTAMCHAWSLRLPWYAFFSHHTAAILLGIPLPQRLATRTDLHVGVATGRRRVSANGLTPHHLSLRPGDIVEHDGLRTTSVERTWVDLAAILSLGELVAAGDFLLWRHHPQTTHDRLVAAVNHYEGRRGLARLRVALGLLTDHADSPPESEIRVAILEAGLPAPEINVVIVSPTGRRIARTDLSWQKFRTAMEYEGDHHRTDRRQWHEDVRRMNALQSIDWSGIRATASDYHQPRLLIERLETALRKGGWNGRRERHWQ